MKMMDMDLFIRKMRGKFRDIFDILRYFAVDKILLDK